VVLIYLCGIGNDRNSALLQSVSDGLAKNDSSSCLLLLAPAVSGNLLNQSSSSFSVKDMDLIMR
jgi:hypothetical protein